MAPDPYKYFLIEARELVEQLGKGVLALERGPAAADLVAQLLRHAHTLKGAARVVRQRGIADHAHAIEDVLAPLRQGGVQLAAQAASDLLGRLDAIATLTSALHQPSAPRSGPIEVVGADVPAEVPSADLEDLDALLAGVAEASVQLGALRRGFPALDRARRLSELLDERLGAPSARLAAGTSSAVRSMAAELREVVESVARGLAGGTEQIDRELRQVREAAEHLRLVPAGLMLSALERAVRDAAQSVGRRVVFGAIGDDVRLEPQVLAVVQRALVQAVRNAVAHGIEPEAERLAAGKPAEGHVSVEVVRHGHRVAFLCRDDGRGVDVAAVERVADREGGATQPARGPEATLRLLLEGGITTSGVVTEISGRGLGLGVVREAASRLGGEVRLRTQQGEGTTLELVVPVSLASVDALIVEAGGRAVAIPLAAVRGTLRVAPSDLGRTASGRSLLFEDVAIPFVQLGQALRVDATPVGGPGACSAIIVEAANGRAAVGVSRLRGTATVVTRALPLLAPAMALIAGTSLDAEGNPQLILDPAGLVEEARRGGDGGAATASISRLPILVIDDSMTTRMLEQSILESAGYQVEVATSAEEALEMARARRYALFLVDVEMPGMDGFEFIAQTRREPGLMEVPAVLVTSRASPEDRARGAQVGARAYIDKSEFDQVELLQRIRALVGER